MGKFFYGIDQFIGDAAKLADMISSDMMTSDWCGLYGVPRGGIPLALELSHLLDLPLLTKPEDDCLVVDDVVDSGATREKYAEFDFVCIHTKPHASMPPTFFLYETTEWIEYWWEVNEEGSIEQNIIRCLEYIGEDPNREGLLETPSRVIRSYDELFAGYKQDPQDVFKVFDAERYDQLILLRDCELYSMCEHHMLPFIGKAHIAYIPNGKVIGISKLARLMEIYARRLQIQERLGEQITSSLMSMLDAKGAACIIEAEHLCMRMRGIGKQNSVMVTNSLKGVFLEDSTRGLAARNELMRLIG